MFESWLLSYLLLVILWCYSKKKETLATARLSAQSFRVRGVYTKIAEFHPFSLSDSVASETSRHAWKRQDGFSLLFVQMSSPTGWRGVTC